jgi:ATP-dependent Clp protease ATP-binding subunit ClpX
MEEVMLEVMYEIPSMTGVRECVINADVITNHAQPLLIREKKAS